jgi:hypothetical protein
VGDEPAMNLRKALVLTLDVLLFPLRAICWPFVVFQERVLDPLDYNIRAMWRYGSIYKWQRRR